MGEKNRASLKNLFLKGKIPKEKDFQPTQIPTFTALGRELNTQLIQRKFDFPSFYRRF